MKFKLSISLLICALLAAATTNAQETNQTTNATTTTTTTTTVPTVFSTTTVEAVLPEQDTETTNKSPESLKINQVFIQLDNTAEIPERLIHGIDKDSLLEFTEVRFNVSEARMKYQVELNIKFSGQVSFEDCVFTVSYPNETQTECLEAYRVILRRPDGVLKIYRRLLSEAIIIKYRLVNCSF
jgi:hypothetical protein